VFGTRGEPAPGNVKVCLNYLGGYSNQATFVLTGLDIDAKAVLVERTLRQTLDVSQFDAFEVQLAHTEKPNAATNHEASALLKVTAKSHDAKKVGRAFTGAVVEMALASYPGFFCTTPPSDASPFGVYWPTLIPATAPQHAVVLEDGERVAIPPSDPETGYVPFQIAPPELPPVANGPTTLAPLGAVFGARSGDKGGNANIGVWARDRDAYAWLHSFLTAKKLRELMPETGELEIHRFELPNLNALNFVIVGLLGEGVASSTRFDPQAKSLGEFLRSRVVPIPQALLGKEA
jgi:hypothetical protein